MRVAVVQGRELMHSRGFVGGYLAPCTCHRRARRTRRVHLASLTSTRRQMRQMGVPEMQPPACANVARFVTSPFPLPLPAPFASSSLNLNALPIGQALPGDEAQRGGSPWKGL